MFDIAKFSLDETRHICGDLWTPNIPLLFHLKVLIDVWSTGKSRAGLHFAKTLYWHDIVEGILQLYDRYLHNSFLFYMQPISSCLENLFDKLISVKSMCRH